MSSYYEKDYDKAKKIINIFNNNFIEDDMDEKSINYFNIDYIIVPRKKYRII